jgi:hypothetical protein
MSQYRKLGMQSNHSSYSIRNAMSLGWIGVFGVNAGIASMNNMSNDILHTQLRYYFQGISLAQKIIALTSIFVLGVTSILASHQPTETPRAPVAQQPADFWEKPLTNSASSLSY